MNFLFVHNNFPAQFRHLAAHLARDAQHRVVAIGAPGAKPVPGVRLERYRLDHSHIGQTHPFARSFDLECRRAEQVLYAATNLAASGFVPDVVVAHSGWGENLPLRAVFPRARIIVYCEFYYRASGQDVNFDPEFPDLSLDGVTALTARNANGLLALVEADEGLSPTLWQRSTYPRILQDKITVIHEGVDTQKVRPNPEATLVLPNGRALKPGDPVVTFASRNLEPLRGYHVFMRALPAIFRNHPDVDIVILGGAGVSYGLRPPQDQTWRDIFYAEVSDEVARGRVHFLDHVPYDAYLSALQVSAAHVYLTYPFVLSWSLIEAMSAGCAIVASDVAPVQEVVSADCGLLVPFLDAAGVARSVEACLGDPSLRRRLGAKARKVIVDHFDLTTATLPRMTAFLCGA